MIGSSSIADIVASHRLWLAGDVSGAPANLSDASLARANLVDANLSGANLSGTNLRRANLYGANLRGVDLYRANLRHANVYGANLRGANLHRADLTGANLRGANLTGASLSDADLSGTNLRGANLANANLTCSKGVIWAQVGPIGTDRRTVTGVWSAHEQSVTLHAGCFHGDLNQWAAAVENGGRKWDWPTSGPELDRLQAECRAAATLIHGSIHTQLEALA